ncbi:MAG: glucose 1-dehydrogenase [Pseudomonadota bacterium]
MSMLQDKVAVVTGAGAGIGEAAALAMAREGATLVLADVNPDTGEQTLVKIREQGGEATFIPTDVSQPEQVARLIETAVSVYGGLDCAFNNAGIDGALAPLDEVDIDEFDATLAVNLRGVFLCMKYQIPVMEQTGGGSIVNMSSVMGMVGSPKIGAYCAAKFGVLGLTKSAALDCALRGVRINAVCPGAVETQMVSQIMDTTPDVLADVIAAVPMKRMASPLEVAETVIWLCSDRASFVTGAALPIDGAYVAQ